MAGQWGAPIWMAPMEESFAHIESGLAGEMKESKKKTLVHLHEPIAPDISLPTL